MNDYQTSTVNGAEGFERMYGSQYDDEKPSLHDLQCESEEENYELDDFDTCNCSDPGCPCRGNKRGGSW